jgi:hypothetical protein
MSKKQLSEEALAYFRHQGAQGGKIGSRRLTAAQRKARAQKAGRASARAKKARKTEKPQA